MTRVLVIATNLRQASFRVRIEALIAPLRENGIGLDVRVRPRSWLARRALLRSAGRYDAVLLQRKLLDPGDARLLRRHARRIYFDVDDAVMIHAHRVGLISRWRTRRRFDATCPILDHVVAGNEHLAGIFRARGCSVTVLPTVVDPQRYLTRTHAATDRPRLVWIGSRSTLGYLRKAVPALAQAAQQVAGLELVTIADETLSPAPLPVEHVEWSAEAEAAALVRGDIGIAPTPHNPWTLGKCGFKIVQYMAAGLPVIASPVGANAELVVEGQTGFLPRDAGEWAEAIAMLARDAELRQRMGLAGRQRVIERYSIARAVEAWAELILGSPNDETRNQNQ